MAKKIRIGLIGGGEGSFIGGIHYRAAMLDGYYELVCGAFSSDPEKSKRSAGVYHVDPQRAYPGWKEMFEKEAAMPEDKRMQAVIIATPNYLHYPQAIRALENGIHVICDKPMTISLEEAEALAGKVKETGLVFALTHTYTGYAMVKEARQIIKSGKIGNIRKIVVEYPQGWLSTPVEETDNKQAGWRSNPEFNGPGGCLGDIGVHAANLAEYISGLTIESLCADINSFVSGRELDDDANVLLRLRGGARAILYASQISAGEENPLKIRVYGEKGGIEWQQHEPSTLMLRMLDQPAQVLRAGQNYEYLSDIARWNLRLPAGHPEGFIEAFANIYRNAATDILRYMGTEAEGTEFAEYPTVYDGVKGMQFIEKVIESAQSSNKWIPFD